MNKFALMAVGAAFCTLAPAAAMAQSTISGTVTVQKGTGPLLICTATAGLNGSGPATSTQLTSLVLTGSGGLCSTVQFPNVPRPIVQTATTFTIVDLFADTTVTPGDCRGDLVGTISGGVVSHNNAVLPEVDSGTGDCVIDGSLS